MEAEAQLIEMIGEFSDIYLDEEFKYLNVKLAIRIIEGDEFSIRRGKLENWACAIILAVGQLNFLFDIQLKPFVTQDMLCNYFKVKRQSAIIRARDIRRALNLKLGDEEFSTEFVLSMNIPESDEDLKRIRQLDEVKFLISQDYPEDVDAVDNTELVDLIRNDPENHERLFLLLRSAYFVTLASGYNHFWINDGNGNLKMPFFTSMDECNVLLGNFDEDVKPIKTTFVNMINYIGNKQITGAVINPNIDEFEVSSEMIERIYHDHEKIDYWQIFYAIRH